MFKLAPFNFILSDFSCSVLEQVAYVLCDLCAILKGSYLYTWGARKKFSSQFYLSRICVCVCFLCAVVLKCV